MAPGNDRTSPSESHGMTREVVMLSAQVCECCGWRHAAVGILSDRPEYVGLVRFQCPACREMGAEVVAGVEVPAGSQMHAAVLAADAIGAEMDRLRAGKDRRA